MVNYVEKIKTLNGTQTIGGSQFDDGWVWKVAELNYSLTLGAGATKTFSLSSYLPNDGYDYMVQVRVYLNTGTTAGDTIDCQVYSGSSTSGFYRRATRCLTRTAARQISACTVEIPILASDRNITFKNGDGNGTGTFELSCVRYKRLGTNGESDNYIEKIKIPHQDLTVGGNILNGYPKYAGVTLLSGGAIPAGGTQTFDLSKYLGNHDYICYFNVTTYTPYNDGDSVTLRLSAGSNTNTNSVVCRAINRSATTRCCAGNIEIQIPASDRKVTIYNTGGADSRSTAIYFRACRRVGTNRLSTGNYISNLNNIPVGGYIADGQWTYKWHTIFGAVTFANEAAGDKTYTINNYLPENNQLYEVQFVTYSRTGATSGNICSFWINGNGVATHQVGSYIQTRTASNECDSKSGTLFCKQDSSGNMTVSVDMTSNVATGNCGLYLIGYRRIGTNQ